MNQTFKTKSDVTKFLMTQDVTKGIVKACTPITKIVCKENPELFDKITEAIESAELRVSKYGSGFCAVLISRSGKFSEIHYEASRVPKAYAFAAILKEWLPE